MRTNFVLVDFENVQPKDFGLLKGGPFQVKLFLGHAQKNLLSTVHALFKKELTEQQLAQLFAALCHQCYVKTDGRKVSYALPSA